MTLSTKVYKKLLQVPEGKITTYSDLARAVGVIDGQRAIGNIMKKNLFPVIVPVSYTHLTLPTSDLV